MLSKYCYLAFAPLAGLAIGLPTSTSFGGGEYIPTKTGDGVAKNPRLVLAKGNGIDLSFSYEGAFGGGGLKVGEEVPFSSKLGLHFGTHKLQEWDRLCGPKHDGNYFLVKKGNWSPCRYYSGPTVHLPNLRMVGSREGSSSSSSVYLPSCKFTLNEKKMEGGKKGWTITFNKCQSEMYHNRWEPYIPTATLEAEYVID